MRSRTKAWRTKNKRLNRDIEKGLKRLAQAQARLNADKLALENEDFWVIRKEDLIKEIDRHEKNVQKCQKALDRAQEEKRKHRAVLDSPRPTAEAKIDVLLGEIDELTEKRADLYDQIRPISTKINQKRSEICRKRKIVEQQSKQK